MKPTRDKVFLDSNILIYSYSRNEPDKREIACQIIADNYSIISTQVLQEFINTVTRKYEFSYQEALNGAEECCRNNQLHINTEKTVFKACLIAQKYGYSFYDCLIISSAIESDCKIIYSEDLQHKQIINNSITIINPFI